MGRIRTIKPEFPQSETVGKLSRDARLLFILIWTIADDAGRARAASRMLASLLYPYDDDVPNLIGGWLDELESKDCIRRYEVDGSVYLEVVNWLKHQKIDKPSASRLPAFPEHSTKPRERSRGLARPREGSATDLGPRTVDQGPYTEDRVVDGGGRRAAPAAKPSKPIPDNIALIAGNLWKQFCDAYRGPISKETADKFRALLAAGENADPIIAAAPRANPEMPAEQWLEERAWTQPPPPMPVTPKKPRVTQEADEIAREIATIAGQDWEFLEPGWCGVTLLVQKWLTEGWPREMIVAGVKAQVTSRAPEKISNVNYFEKGLARFIAQHSRPAPQVIEHQAQTVEVTRGRHETRGHDPRSGVAAIREVYAEFRAAAEGQHGGGGEVSDATVRRLPA